MSLPRPTGLKAPSKIGRPSTGGTAPRTSGIPAPSSGPSSRAQSALAKSARAAGLSAAQAERYVAENLNQLGGPEPSSSSGNSTDDLKIGDRVFVGGTKAGVIAFIGEAQFAPGEWAGVALDEPIGKNDGSVAGVRYFQCEPMKGVFSRLSKLSRTPGSVPVVAAPKSTDSTGEPRSITPQNTGAPNGTLNHTPARSQTPRIGLAASKVKSTSNASLNKESPPTSTTNLHRGGLAMTKSKVKVGDRVVVSGTKTGVLRYVGQTDFAKGEWAGVELDDPQGKNDGAVAGKRYFDCRPNYGLFAPMHKVARYGGGATPSPQSRSLANTSLRSARERSGSQESISSVSSTASSVSRSRASKSGQRPSTLNLTATTSALQKALKEKEEHIEQLLRERDLERAEVARAAAHVDEAETELTMIRQDKERLFVDSEDQLKQLRALVLELEKDKKDLSLKLEDEKRKVEDLQFQIEEEVISKDDLECQTEADEAKLRDVERNYKREKERADKLQQEMVALKDIVSTQQKKLKESDDTQTTYLDQMEELTYKLNQAENKVKTFESSKLEDGAKTSQLSLDLEERASRVHELEETLSAQRKEIKDLQEKLGEVKDELTDTNNKKQKMQDNITDLTNKLQANEKSQNKLSDEVRTLRTKGSDLQHQLSTSKSKVEELTEDRNKVEAQLSELMKNSGDSSKQLSLMNQQVAEKNRKIEELQSDLSSSTHKVASLNESIEQLKVDSDKEREDIVNKTREEVKEAEGRLEDVQTELDRTKNKVSKLSEDFEKERQELEGKKDLEITDLKKQLSSNAEELEKQELQTQAHKQVLDKITLEKEAMKCRKNGFIKESEMPPVTHMWTKHSRGDYFPLGNVEIIGANYYTGRKKKRKLSRSHLAIDADEGRKIRFFFPVVNNKHQHSHEQTSIGQNQQPEESTVDDKGSEKQMLASQTEPQEMMSNETTQVLTDAQPETSSTVDDQGSEEQVLAFQTEPREMVSNETTQVLPDNQPETSSTVDDQGSEEQVLAFQTEPREMVSNETTQVLPDNQPETSSTVDDQGSEKKVLAAQTEPQEMVSNETTQVLPDNQPETKSTVGDQGSEEQLLASETEPRGMVSNETTQVSPDNQPESRSTVVSDTEDSMEDSSSSEYIPVCLEQIEDSFDSESSEDIPPIKKHKGDGCLSRESGDEYDILSDIQGPKICISRVVRSSTTKCGQPKKSDRFEKEKAEKNLKRIESEKDAINSELIQARVGVSKLETEIQQNTQSKQSMEEQIQVAQEERDRAQKSKQDIQKQLEEVRTEKDKVITEKNQMQQDAMTSKADLQAKDMQVEELRKEVEKLKADTKSQQEELMQKSQSEVDSSALSQNLEDIKSQLSQAQSKLREAEAEKLKLKAEVEQSQLVKEDRKKLEDQTKQLQSELQAADKRYREAKADLETATSDLKSKADNSHKQLQKQEEELGEYKKKVGELERENTSLSGLKASLASLEKDREKERNQLLDKIHSLEARVKETQNNSNNIETTGDPALARLKSDKEAADGQIDFLNSVIVDMQRKNEEMKLRLQAMEAGIYDNGDAVEGMDISPSRSVAAPRLFCDICDMFDLHDTDDCPKQAMSESPPATRHHGDRHQKRLYCEICEDDERYVEGVSDPESMDSPRSAPLIRVVDETNTSLWKSQDDWKRKETQRRVSKKGYAEAGTAKEDTKGAAMEESMGRGTDEDLHGLLGASAWDSDDCDAEVAGMGLVRSDEMLKMTMSVTSEEDELRVFEELEASISLEYGEELKDTEALTGDIPEDESLIKPFENLVGDTDSYDVPKGTDRLESLGFSIGKNEEGLMEEDGLFIDTHHGEHDDKEIKGQGPQTADEDISQNIVQSQNMCPESSSLRGDKPVSSHKEEVTRSAPLEDLGSEVHPAVVKESPVTLDDGLPDNSTDAFGVIPDINSQSEPFSNESNVTDGCQFESESSNSDHKKMNTEAIAGNGSQNIIPNSTEANTTDGVINFGPGNVLWSKSQDEDNGQENHGAASNHGIEFLLSRPVENVPVQQDEQADRKSLSDEFETPPSGTSPCITPPSGSSPASTPPRGPTPAAACQTDQESPSGQSTDASDVTRRQVKGRSWSGFDANEFEEQKPNGNGKTDSCTIS